MNAIEQMVNAVADNDFKPELHPRDDEGKFTESGGGVIDSIADFGNESEREIVKSLTEAWFDWPTNSDTAAMWQATEEKTNNTNVPSDNTGASLSARQVDEDEKDAFTKYSDEVSEYVRENHGDSITLHRFIHGDTADDLLSGKEVPPRTLGSWTVDESNIIVAMDEIPTPSGELVPDDEAVIVTKEVSAENIADHYEINPELRDEEEVIAALPQDEDLSDATVRTVAEIKENG